jgi:IS30 family transposase
MGKQYAQLTVEERVEIYRLQADGKSRRAIGACLDRSAATISRELRRNSLATKAWEEGYAPLRAQALTERRRQRGRPHKLTSSPELRAVVRGYLEQGWSPEQIAGRFTNRLYTPSRCPKSRRDGKGIPQLTDGTISEGRTAEFEKHGLFATRYSNAAAARR